MSTVLIVVIVMFVVFGVIDLCAVLSLTKSLEELEKEVDILWREAHR